MVKTDRIKMQKENITKNTKVIMKYFGILMLSIRQNQLIPDIVVASDSAVIMFGVVEEGRTVVTVIRIIYRY